MDGGDTGLASQNQSVLFLESWTEAILSDKPILRTLTGLYGPWNYCSNPRSVLLFLASLERLCFTKDIHGLVSVASLRTLERLYSCRDNSYCFYMHTPLMFHVCTNYFLYMVIYVITSCVMLWCSLPLPTVRTAWLTLQASDLSLG